MSVMLDDEDELKLIDFAFGNDIVQYQDTILQQYIPPEEKCSKEGDVYSIGVLTFVLLTGQHFNRNDFVNQIQNFSNNC